jgi:hypothetical protein
MPSAAQAWATVGGKQGVALQGVGPVLLAGIHVGFAGVAGRVDQKFRLGLAQKSARRRTGCNPISVRDGRDKGQPRSGASVAANCRPM